MKDVFDYRDYKVFLNDHLDDEKLGGRGARAKLSEAMQCKTSYTAQVLRGNANFSLEQGEAIAEFLNLTEEEGHFLLLLIQFQRAGTQRLKDRFEKQMNSIRSNRLMLKNRLKVKEFIPEVSASTFYSSWHYLAIYVLISIPGFQNVEVIARKLVLPHKKVVQILEFLVEVGLLKKSRARGYEIGNSRIHLGADSPLISKHHTNWRIQAIRSLDTAKSDDLHYSSVISVSVKDAARIREMFVKLLQTLDPLISDSKEEKLCSIGVDFFEL